MALQFNILNGPAAPEDAGEESKPKQPLYERQKITPPPPGANPAQKFPALRTANLRVSLRPATHGFQLSDYNSGKSKQQSAHPGGWGPELPAPFQRHGNPSHFPPPPPRSPSRGGRTSLQGLRFNNNNNNHGASARRRPRSAGNPRLPGVRTAPAGLPGGPRPRVSSSLSFHLHHPPSALSVSIQL